MKEATINPTKLIQDNAELAHQYWQLIQNITLASLRQPTDQVVAPDSNDHRFDDEAWRKNPYYHAIVQSYLINARYLEKITEDLEGLSEANRRQLSFLVRQFINALAPSNFFVTNPEAVRKCRQSWGLSLVKGLENFYRDMSKSRQLLNISITDESAFEVGRNVATTPSKVVFQNRLFQLIQYEPTTETVHQTPLLIVPPFINKYYIMDLTEEKSMVHWLVAQGHSVFMISWVNPDASHCDVTFEDYVQEGALRAMDAVEKATGEHEINAIGYCVGGTLLAIALAHLKVVDDNRVKSSTIFATLLDFREPGEIGAYINEQMVQALETYINNNLCEPNALTIAGTPIALTSIDTPSMFISTQQDHIALWKATYAGFKLFGGEKHFVLGQSGHIAGIINPPEFGKYGYFLNDTEADTPDDWFQGTEHHQGSWWPKWQSWISRFQGKEMDPVTAPDVNDWSQEHYHWLFYSIGTLAHTKQVLAGALIGQKAVILLLDD